MYAPAGGLPVDSGDYDFRTTLHLAAVEGNLKAGAYTRPLFTSS